MDISYTNVLEGARQYFQGLPAATTSSSGSPANQLGQRENDGSVHSEQHSAVPYWDHQNEGQGTNLPNRDVVNSAQVSNRTRTGHENPTVSYHYDKGQGYSSYATTSQMSQVYQPHIPSSNSYYEVQQHEQPRTSYVNSAHSAQVQHTNVSANSSSSYNYIAQQAPTYSNYTQNQTSSSSSQSQDLHYNYKMYNQQVSRSQASYPSNYYPPQTQQRSSHQPKVAPTNIYHSRSSTKPTQNLTTANTYVSKSNHTALTSQNEQRIPIPNGVSYSEQYNKYYQQSTKYTPATYSTTTTTTTYSNQYLNNNQNYVNSRAIIQRSHLQQQQPVHQTSKYAQHIDTKQVITNTQKMVQMAKQKRESPLDLSVKTVKTSADSTLSEYDERSRMAQHMMKYQSARAPKVDFLPNFNMPQVNREKHLSVNKPNYNYALSTSSSSNPMPPIPVRESLPRIDIPSLNKNMSMAEMQRKRTQDQAPPSSIPEKMPKVDTWRQTIDKQIEQRLSSYTKSRLEPEPQTMNTPINGNMHTQIPANKLNTYPEAQQRLNPGDINNYNNKVHSSATSGYHYPQFNMNTYQQNYPQHYQNQMKPKPQVPPPQPNKQQTANKKVLSLLRNSLQIKGAKEAQKKMEQEQLMRNYREIQQPSTDVMAPLQPKPGIIGRRNVSPFTAASLERNSNTPPAYKFHLPKAIDSVIFSDAEKEQHDQQASMGTTPTTDLDGLAAFLAARIRTKAELKQISPSEQTSNNNTFRTESKQMNPTEHAGVYNTTYRNEFVKTGPPEQSSVSNAFRTDFKQSFSETNSNSGFQGEFKQLGHPEHSFNLNATTSIPPKLKREPVPKKLFNRSDNDSNQNSNKRSDVRSSSETSIFDFPDSDNEAEMPVLERQSLVEMRKDRKTVPTQFTGKFEEEEQSRRTPSPFDLLFNQTCDTFMEQLKSGAGKKRGRRKKSKGRDDETKPEVNVENIKEETVDVEEKEIKLDPNISIKVEPEEVCDTVKETPASTEVSEVTVKEEDLDKKEEVEDVPVEPEVINEKKEDDVNKDGDSDSDTPLSVCKKKIKQKASSEMNTTTEDISNEISSDSELEGISKNIRNRKKKDLKSNLYDLKVVGTINIGKPGKKPVFGDGSHFQPGWEEDLCRYKKSLRIPRMLIQVTRPPNCQRLSTSLPDLDPCPISPAASSTTDFEEKRKIKTESIDSDIDSNCSFNFSMAKTNYDSEEGSVSVKSTNSKSSILDKLIERYGGKKRKRVKKTEEGPKIIPKSENPLELLPTPSLEVTQKKNPILKTDSVLLGFRKKTVDNFKGAFINNTNTIVGVNEFTTVVMKSRTRTETRVLKEKATIREVFGEDRPASAPPVTCLQEIKPDDEEENKQKDKENLSSKSNDKLTKLFSNNETFFRALTNKVIKTEVINDEEVEVKKEDDNRTDISSNDGETTKKKSKLRIIRRKFSSGFDYIRKKKKQVKKEEVENEVKLKPKKRTSLAKATPESVEDIQKEIKMWVLNKGVGESHLHRASRAGYTDITAYCLEVMACNPSPKDNAGYTPLHEACSRGHLDIARLLLQYGAHVSESAQGGIRPLHEAAENGFVEIVRLLLSYGADPVLATYSGITPLQLAGDEQTVKLLQQHLDELQGKSTIPWSFAGPATCFDKPDQGFDPLADVPEADSLPEEDDVELEISEQLLPNLYSLPDSETDRWVLLQDLSNILKIKSKETLLRQLNVSSNTNKSDIVKELKTLDFLEQARCCQFLNANEKLNTRNNKIFLVKYTENVKRLLNIEKVIINVR